MIFRLPSFGKVSPSGYVQLDSRSDQDKQTDRIDALSAPRKALGANPRKNPLSENFSRNRKHLKDSKLHSDALTTWKAKNKSVFEGQDSDAKSGALESLMKEFCRPLTREEARPDAEGKIAYKGLCSAQKETLDIMAQTVLFLEA